MATKKIIKNGIEVYQGKEKDDLREPRFEMPLKEPLQNDKIRIVKRIGLIQTVLEIYHFNEEHTFRFIRVDNEDTMGLNFLNEVYERYRNSYGLTLQNLLPIGYTEYKANFPKGIWLEPK